mmetsp:Transcript_36651/g.58872  ORF Transcript_36651/g.58872 Transcript_36651/m.58872 type:complete len:248 (+) Transcript_36651:835-1578(+)
MVGGDDDERVDVSDHVSEDRGEEHSGGHLCAANGIPDGRKRREGEERVGCEALGHLSQRAELPLKSAAHYGDDGAGELAGLERVLLARQPLLLRLARAAAVHLLHGVGGVVEPLPDECEADHLAVPGQHGQVALAQGRHVALHQVGVRLFAELVVVQVVVLDVPRLGHHPVHPVADAALQPLGECAAVEAASHLSALGLRSVVASVAHVVAHHGPARADRGGHHERGDGVHAADRREHVGQQQRGGE